MLEISIRFHRQGFRITGVKSKSSVLKNTGHGFAVKKGTCSLILPVSPPRDNGET